MDYNTAETLYYTIMATIALIGVIIWMGPKNLFNAIFRNKWPEKT